MEKMERKIVASLFTIGMVIVLVGIATAPAMAEVVMDGNFTLTSAVPTVTSVTLYDSDEVNTTETMSPLVEYAVKIEVGDANTLYDLRNISVYFDVDGVPISGHAQYSWVPDAAEGGPGTWSMVDVNGTTWELGSITQPTSECVKTIFL
jgi:hypothetical protein